ncbi:MAG TPA: isoleucine--tRNA ligase [Terriglobales bacterium]|nr:isoleucine--tRNA ligase [Terriglobales bacterium]
MAEKLDVKGTLNLPRTSFPMKAALALKEPETLKKWEAEKLYERVLESKAGRPVFVLHDGPPYANGNIHLGTTLNKLLKDFIVKTKAMQGHYAPYIPGWDCHGLPIEIHVDRQLGPKKAAMTTGEIREECRKYALKFIDVQRNEFKRLGVLGRWAEPYLTMDPKYEAMVLRYLADFFERGSVYKGKRPVHWCIHCETALAEAEIEYRDKTSPSIYVRFQVVSDLSAKFPALAGRRVYALIWTTTPWTLPANMAIAFHPDHEYVAAEVGQDVYILAKKLLPAVAAGLGWPAPRVLATFPGREMEGLKARHPWIDRESVFVLADYVTLEDGTGAVHTAPGHGADDYLTGVAYGIDIYTPVDDEGKFTPDVARYAGVDVFTANPLITADMKREGSLLKETSVSHSYPHCWRCKNPVVFRATEQWFISMDKGGFRNTAREAIRSVRWIPEWGQERIDSMVAGRPDWCISRQRSWGVPIPAFGCRACGAVLADAAIVRRVADIFEREGSASWYLREPSTLLPAGTKCPACGATEFRKEMNILDVWFESGASQNILDREPGHRWPADLYIEGHDQHRGWFQSSLLIGVGVKGRSPFKTCVTCGFILDEQGRAMSKSFGNAIEPGEIIARSGAEVLRLWVAMLNYKEDARFSREIEQRLVEAYRKIRNTWRFLLGNLDGFDPDADAVPAGELLDLDRWILHRAEEVGRRVRRAYEDYEYHTVVHALLDFFTVDLSSFYLDVVKDRAYCSGRTSALRRSAQTAMFEVLRSTLLLAAPILSFTAEEAWDHVPAFAGKEASIHLGEFPAERDWLCGRGRAFVAEMAALLSVREKVLKSLEKARAEGLVGNSLEAMVTLRASGDEAALLERKAADLPALFIVSAVAVEKGAGPELDVAVVRAPGAKCERCWNYSTFVGRSAERPTLCERCDAVVRTIVP